MESLKLIDEWPVENAAAAVVSRDGRTLGTHGDIDRVFRLASVTKPITAYATLMAVEEGAISLDTPAGPPGSTVRHLLAHASGLAFDDHKAVAQPGTRRLYSNAGFDELGDAVTKHAGMPFAEYVREGVLEPLGMAHTDVSGAPASGAMSTISDLMRFAAELQVPTLLHAETFHQAMTVEFPGLTGVVPGFGHQKPNDWGLGFEIRGNKSPHWTGIGNSPRTFGHFGLSGAFLWVDPDAGAACMSVADRDFDQWAKDVWPPFSDAILAELVDQAQDLG